ncbi:MAG: hypothetical protein RR653_14695 [Clostridia bacterium]
MARVACMACHSMVPHRMKERLKKLGGMALYDVSFSYIDNETFEEHYVSIPEQSGGKLIPKGFSRLTATSSVELMSAFQLIPCQSAEDAAFKALGVD